MVSPAIEQMAFLARAQSMHELGGGDASLDVIYDAVDELMRKGKFAEIDSVLAVSDASPLATDMLLALLTSTLPAKNRLPLRTRFFDNVKKVLVERGEYRDGLLAGLGCDE